MTLKSLEIIMRGNEGVTVGERGPIGRWKE